MKKIFFVTLLLGMGLMASAQSPFACTTQGARLRYMNVDGNGHEVSVSEVEVTKVEAFGDSFSITQVTQMYLNGKRFMKPIETRATVKDGAVLYKLNLPE